MWSYLKGFSKSTLGILQHASQWASLDFNDIDIPLKETSLKDEGVSSGDEASVGVYFIHGTADHACSFKAIATRLKKLGLTKEVTSMHLVSFDGRYQGKGIDDYGRQLLEKIEKNGHKQVILCGHSRGGVLAAWFNQYLAKDANIKVLHCISICGPFRGSYLAQAPVSYFSSSVEQMSKNSSFLQELRDKINSEPNSPYTFVIAGLDDIVPNRCGYVLEYVDNNTDSLFKLDDHGHLSVMTSTRLTNHLQSVINQSARPPQPQQLVSHELSR
jgi:esterase/lipase